MLSPDKVHEYGGGGFIIDTSDKKRGLVYSHFKDSRQVSFDENRSHD